MWTTLNVPDSIIFNKTLEAQGVTMFDMGHLSLSVYIQNGNAPNRLYTWRILRETQYITVGA